MNMNQGDSDNLFSEIQKAVKVGKQYGEQEKQPSQRWVIPNYRILHELHRGGQGVVFKATQESTKRTVALKFILHGVFATERQRFRFEREIDLASRLTHPNIVTVFDGGISNNQPFCAMEYIDGRPLSRFNPASEELSVRESIQLFLKICDAVGYAHSKGVIHRDLKPANILVDRQMEPHILDFGLAKVLDAQPENRYSPRTMTGEFVGTLTYASPEQAQADPGLVDTRSDVYSLGVVFYEFLTGAMPYDVSGSMVATLNNIANADPARPTRSRAGLDLDIETILLKALSKEPDRRYQNAQQLANEFQRFLNGEPIDARRDSHWYVLKKNLVRYRKTAISVLAFVALLIVSLVVIVLFYLQAVHDRNLADVATKNEMRQRNAEMAQRKRAEFQTYVARIAAADASVRSYSPHDVVRNLYVVPEEQRNWEYWHVFARSNLAKETYGFHKRKRVAHQSLIWSASFHPEQNWLVSGGADGKLVFWNRQNQSLGYAYEFAKPIKDVRFHPDGRRLLVGFVEGDATIMEVEVDESGDEWSVNPGGVQFSSQGLRLNELELSSSGDYVLLAAGGYGENGKGLVFETDSGNLLHESEFTGQPCMSIAMSADERIYVCGTSDLFVFDSATGERKTKLDGSRNWITDIAIHPDGDQMLSSALESEVRIWDLKSGKHLTSLFGHTNFVNSVAYSPDGTQIATAGKDNTLRTWNAETHSPLSVLWGHYSEIFDVAYSTDGKEIATTGIWCVKTWSHAGVSPLFAPGQFWMIADLAVNSDSSRVMVCDLRGQISEWCLDSKQQKSKFNQIRQPYSAIRSVAYSADDKYVAWANDDRQIYVIDRSANDKLSVLRAHSAPVTAVSFSPDNQDLYSCSEDGKVLHWEPSYDTNSAKGDLLFHADDPVKALSLTPNGRFIILSTENRIFVLDSKSGEPIRSWDRPRAGGQRGYRVAISPDSKRVAAPVDAGNVAIFEIATGKEVGRLLQSSDPVLSLDYSPDGKRIACSYTDGKVRIWDAERHMVVLHLQGFGGHARVVKFSPDGMRLIGGLYDGSLYLWDALPVQERF